MAVVLGRPPPFKGTPIFGALPLGVAGGFNVFRFLQLAGLGAGPGLATAALRSLVLRFGTTLIATRFAIVLLRTIGFIDRSTGLIPGFPIPSNPITRLIFGAPTFLFPFGTPFISSFLFGFAYKNREELVRGWLSFFGELALKDVPGVEGNLETALRRLALGDFGGFGAAAANALKEDVGLAAVVSFFEGIRQVELDFQAAGLPTLHPAPWVFGGFFAVVNYFDALITSAGRGIGEATGEIFGGPAEEPPPAGEPLILDPGLGGTGGFLEELTDPDRNLPTTTGEVREFLATFRRLGKRISGFARILGELREGDPKGRLADKLLKVVRRAVGF